MFKFIRDLFCPGKSTDEICRALKPGDSYCFTSGINYYGEKCGICGNEFVYSYWSPPFIFRTEGPYWYVKFGEFTPKILWYCTIHTNKQIKKKIKELDK